MADNNTITAIERRLERIERLMTISSKEVLNTEEAATLLGITIDRLRHLTAEMRVPYYKRSNRNYFSKSELERWMLARDNRVAPISEIEAQAAIYTETHPLSALQ